MVEFKVGPGPRDSRWVWTEGIKAYGQHEMAMPLTWDEGNWRDGATKDLLSFICSYIDVQPKRISAGETLRYGWTSLGFRDPGPADRRLPRDVLIIQEIQAPLREGELEYVDGAQRAMILLMLQGATLHRLGLPPAPMVDYPHRSTRALVCKRLTQSDASTFDIIREPAEPQDEQSFLRDSRWSCICADPMHDHTAANELAVVHIVHLVESHPHIFPYLAMPAGSRVTFDGSQTVIHRPDGSEPYGDTAERFTGLR